MQIRKEEWDPGFVKECKARFGLEPEQIKTILNTLCINNCLNVQELLQNVEDLKQSLHESTVYINKLLNNEITAMDCFRG